MGTNPHVAPNFSIKAQITAKFGSLSQQASLSDAIIVQAAKFDRQTRKNTEQNLAQHGQNTPQTYLGYLGQTPRQRGR